MTSAKTSDSLALAERILVDQVRRLADVEGKRQSTWRALLLHGRLFTPAPLPKANPYSGRGLRTSEIALLAGIDHPDHAYVEGAATVWDEHFVRQFAWNSVDGTAIDYSAQRPRNAYLGIAVTSEYHLLISNETQVASLLWNDANIPRTVGGGLGDAALDLGRPIPAEWLAEPIRPLRR